MKTNGVNIPHFNDMEPMYTFDWSKLCLNELFAICLIYPLSWDLPHIQWPQPRYPELWLGPTAVWAASLSESTPRFAVAALELEKEKREEKSNTEAH